MKYNRDEIVKEIFELISKDEEFSEEFFKSKKERLVLYHLSLGMYIRNTYKLWEIQWTPELDEQGVDCSVNHPDYISMDIIEKVWELRNKE